MNLSFIYLAFSGIQSPANTLVLTAEDVTNSSDQAVIAAADKSYKNAIVSIVLQREKAGSSKITLSPNFRKVVSALKAAGKDFEVVLPLVKVQDWMIPIVDQSMVEYPMTGAFAKKKETRYLNQIGARAMSDFARMALDESDAKPSGVYLDCRYPAAPIYYSSDSSRRNSISMNGIDPIDVQDVDVTRIEESMAGMSEENKQRYLFFTNFRNNEIRKSENSIAQSWKATGTVGYCVSEAHFLVSPMLRTLEASDFLQKDTSSAFSKILIVPSQTKVNKDEFLKAFFTFDQRVKSPVQYCWIQNKSEVEADNALLNSNSSTQAKLRFGINLKQQ